MPQGGRVILVFVAAGDLEDALTDQRLQAVLTPSPPPVRRASVAHSARAVSASASQGNPPSEVRRPPSKAVSSGSPAAVAKRSVGVDWGIEAPSGSES